MLTTILGAVSIGSSSLIATILLSSKKKRTIVNISLIVIGILSIALLTGFAKDSAATTPETEYVYITKTADFNAESIQVSSVGAGTISLTLPDGQEHDYTYSYMPESNEAGNGYGAVKTYMGYKMITYVPSLQYKLNNLPEAYTDSNGMRRIYDYYFVAMGSFYGEIGDIFQVTLDTGRILLVIKGDEKADKHTDPTNRYHSVDGSVIEFIVDEPIFKQTIGSYGDCSKIQGFEGSITNIELVGHYNF